jgi:uncharacterized protein (DUF302 family)
MKGLRILLVVLIIGLLLPTLAWSSDLRSHGQPMTVNSHYSFSQTISRLKGAINARNLVVVLDVNHKDIMARVGLEGRNSATIGFVGPLMEHKVLTAEPRAALEMPLKIVVRELVYGKAEVIYHQPSFLFRRAEAKH